VKALWVDEDNDPNYAKVAQFGITALYFALRDPRLTPTYLGQVRARGFGVGVYAVQSWPEYGGDGTHGGPGDVFAENVAARLAVVAGTTLGRNHPKVQLDMEDHDPVNIARALTRWRELHRYQDTSWTMEAGQGGWMDAAFVAAVLLARVRLVPQCYNGAMTEVWDTLAYARDLTKRGFPDSLVSPFYDAARLPHGWDGFAFTMGRLP